MRKVDLILSYIAYYCNFLCISYSNQLTLDSYSVSTSLILGIEY